MKIKIMIFVVLVASFILLYSCAKSENDSSGTSNPNTGSTSSGSSLWNTAKWNDGKWG
jgi:hypothetical protein